MTPRNSPNASESGLSAARQEFSTPLIELNTGIAESLSGVIQSWPMLDSAAFMLAMEPVKISFAALAESPKAEYMASENVWKSILPDVTIAETSSVVLPRYVASVETALMPRSVNCATCSPLSLPEAATFAQMPKRSPRSCPNVAAVPTQPLRAFSMSPPAATPDAASCAHAWAAVSKP